MKRDFSQGHFKFYSFMRNLLKFKQLRNETERIQMDEDGENLIYFWESN